MHSLRGICILQQVPALCCVLPTRFPFVLSPYLFKALK